jgi:hypothetical protein
MKTFMLFTGSGPLVILTSHDAITLALARERYGGHFEVVTRDLHESDDLRILDYNGERAFRLFHLAELGRPILHEPR